MPRSNSDCRVLAAIVSIFAAFCVPALVTPALAQSQLPQPEASGQGSGGGTAKTGKVDWKRFHITLRNSCGKPVSIVRHSKMPAGMPWVTRGWTNLKPGESRRVNLKTNNTIYYLYATSADGKTVWSGKGKKGAISKYIHPKRFTRIGAEPVEGPGWKIVPLFRRQYTQGQRDDTVNFTCQ